MLADIHNRYADTDALYIIRYNNGWKYLSIDVSVGL